FTDPPTAFRTGFAQTNVTLGGHTGTVPRGLTLTAAADGSGKVYVGNSITGEIFELDASGNRSTFASGLYGVTNLALATYGNMMAALPAGAGIGSEAIVSPPSFVRVTGGGASVQTVYAFPDSGLVYGTGFSRQTGGHSIPVGFLIDFAQAPDGALYV